MSLNLARSIDFLPPETHFPAITTALREEGWIFIPEFLQSDAYQPLFQRALRLADEYTPAAVGRGFDQQENNFVRTDEIYWLDPSNDVDWFWADLMEQLRLAINKSLILGLFEHEAHYACYQPGSFYKRHVDAFKGEENRIVSVVLYLNPDWLPTDGGEFVIYPDQSLSGESFLPKGGSLAVFLSEDFPHEVLAAHRTRYSIAGWFRVNGTRGDKIDPPA